MGRSGSRRGDPVIGGSGRSRPPEPVKAQFRHGEPLEFENFVERVAAVEIGYGGILHTAVFEARAHGDIGDTFLDIVPGSIRIAYAVAVLVPEDHAADPAEPARDPDIAHINRFTRGDLDSTEGDDVVEGFIPDGHLIETCRNVGDGKGSVRVAPAGIDLFVGAADIGKSDPGPVDGSAEGQGPDWRCELDDRTDAAGDRARSRSGGELLRPDKTEPDQGCPETLAWAIPVVAFFNPGVNDVGTLDGCGLDPVAAVGRDRLHPVLARREVFNDGVAVFIRPDYAAGVRHWYRFPVRTDNQVAAGVTLVNRSEGVAEIVDRNLAGGICEHDAEPRQAVFEGEVILAVDRVDIFKDVNADFGKRQGVGLQLNGQRTVTRQVDPVTPELVAGSQDGDEVFAGRQGDGGLPGVPGGHDRTVTGAGLQRRPVGRIGVERISHVVLVDDKLEIRYGYTCTDLRDSYCELKNAHFFSGTFPGYYWLLCTNIHIVPTPS
ncbi:hypothetical protein [Moorella sp. E306M]|uniref:hypothetical protein n=1 Tax=Moorella sp. E306M TaxID=2572683 RepID=UPI00209C347A|nr:hypothetical protein [Moorella sp. E306M]